MTRIALVVAIAENGVIGRDGGLPWRLSTDLKRFKADTMGKAIVMGRRTWQSIGRPLPGRLNIVVTRQQDFSPEGAEVAGSLADALAIARERAGELPNGEEICVIGGGEIFAEALPLAQRLYVTHVEARVEGDTFFPRIDPALWRAISITEVPPGERDDHATRYAVYERRHSVP